jgi:ubiquinol-cytochrome c reductase cytochrome b subunit
MICIYNNPNQKLGGKSRIGPHNLDILSIIIGSLLGDASAEKLPLGKGTRITFYQEACHLKYLLYLHHHISILGYCNTKVPDIETRLGKGGKVRKFARFST